MLTTIVNGLKKTLPAKLVDELLEAYQEAKENFYSGGLRLSAVAGGRFCEAALRLLEFITTGKFTDINRQINADKLILALRNLPNGSHPDSVRLHLPRAIRVVYDIRSSRDNAHLADGIDPNLQDATLVVSVLDWILAELVRLHHNISPNEAQQLIDALIVRRVPVVQDFDGFKKVLNSELQASAFVLVLLYECGSQGATLEQLSSWVRPNMRANLVRTLRQLTDDRAFLHYTGTKYMITKAGIAEVENRKLHGSAI
jgi:hypothetical protein